MDMPMDISDSIVESFAANPPESVAEPDNPTTAWCAGFDIARRIKGVLAQNGQAGPFEPEQFEDIVKCVASDYEWDPDDLWEEFFLAWDKVRLPEGQDRLTMAWADILATDDWEPLAGKYPSEAMRQACERVGALARRLAESNGGIVFLPTRRIGDLLGKSHDSAARMIRYLKRDHVLVLVRPHTRYMAAEYRYVRPEDRPDTVSAIPPSDTRVSG